MASPDPDLDRALRREPPRDLHRVLLGYLASVLAVACAVPALVVGWFGASNCTLDGFACLGYLVYGALAALLLAVIALPLIAWRMRLGLWFGLLTVALVAAPLWLGDGSTYAGTAFLGPGLAAWVSEPRQGPVLGPLAPRTPPTSTLRHWGPRFAAVLVVSIVVPCLDRVM